jgi:serine/threonine protein phosphatase PrpC
MHAYHNQLWQQELERQKHTAQQHNYSNNDSNHDIADAPTLLMPPDASPANDPYVSTRNGLDIADMPTIVSHSWGVTDEPASPPATEAEVNTGSTHKDAEVSTPVSGDVQAQEYQHNAEPESMEHPTSEENSATVEEEHLESNQETEQRVSTEQELTDQQTATGPETEQATEGASSATAAGGFPTLAPGTMRGDRYEVTQVLNDAENEHIYEVTDRKGYLHCWNCGSEQNAEGDEFCLDCGAELLNTSYILHEYPASGAQSGDAQVLQGAIVNTFVEDSATYVVEQPQSSQSSFPTGVHLVAACDSDAGTVRRADINEDSTLVLLLERVHESLSSPAGLFVVADGMGGHANGQGASRTTIALLAERVVRDLILPPFEVEKKGETAAPLDDEQIKEILRNAIEDANGTLCQMNQRDKSDAGCTLTGFMMVGDRAFIFNVGDSRTYMLRDEKLYQLTNDHSLVGQLVAGGLIEPEDVYTHPQRNQIFRSIGDKQNVQVDLFTQQVHPGDVLLSCSDGLWEMVRDPQIAEILNQAADPQAACAQLIASANENGGEDNVSAVVVFVH